MLNSSTCKFRLPHEASFYLDLFANSFFNSLEDETALQAKVNEAMAVYDEYVKSQSGPQTEGAAEEPKAEEKAEEKA